MKKFVSLHYQTKTKKMNSLSLISNLENSLIVCLGGKQYACCSDFNEAATKIREHIDNFMLGSNKFYSKKNAGEILHPIKGKIAFVSYNGRVWKNEKEEIKDLLLSDI